MKNKILAPVALATISASLFLIPATAQAQSFADGVRFGAKGALNMTRTRGILEADNDIIETGSAAGFAIGALATFESHPNVTIQPEFMYSLKNVDILTLDGVPVDGEVDLSYIEIPVLVKLHPERRGLDAVPFVLVGGTFSFLTSAELQRMAGSVTIAEDVADELNSFNLGFTFGGGLDLQNEWGIVTVDARYTLALGDLAQVSNGKLDTFYVGAGVIF